MTKDNESPAPITGSATCRCGHHAIVHGFGMCLALHDNGSRCECEAWQDRTASGALEASDV